MPYMSEALARSNTTSVSMLKADPHVTAGGVVEKRTVGVLDNGPGVELA